MNDYDEEGLKMIDFRPKLQYITKNERGANLLNI